MLDLIGGKETMWRVKHDSGCGQCNIGGDCQRTGIDDDHVFVHLVTGIKFAFVHDCAECGCMCEVEEESSADKGSEAAHSTTG